MHTMNKIYFNKVHFLTEGQRHKMLNEIEIQRLQA